MFTELLLMFTESSWRRVSGPSLSTGRLRPGGEALPRPPLAEPRQSHQQQLGAAGPGDAGEPHQGGTDRRPRRVRAALIGRQFISDIHLMLEQQEKL